MKNKVRMITFWFLEKKIDGSPDYIVKNIKLGDKLYDEVFDYSFDKAETITNRTNLLVKEIRRLSSKDLTKIQGILKPKLEFNYNHFMKIANDNFNWVYSLHGN